MYSEFRTCILAGGFGTRLRSVVDKVPKVMAEVQKRPFIEYIFDRLIINNIVEVTLLVSYKSEIIKSYYKNKYKNLRINYYDDDKPYGTGGSIKNYAKTVNNLNLFIINGDTYFPLSIEDFIDYAKDKQITIATTSIKNNNNRYGYIQCDKNNKITAFNEKTNIKVGKINAGSYFIKKDLIENYQKVIFSLENEFLPDMINAKKQLYSYYSEEVFIDIGVPEDYRKANIMKLH